MARTPDALATEIIPAWHAFVAGLIPQGVKIQAAVGGTVPLRAVDSNSSEAVYFRRILSGSIGQPQPRKVWETARGARSLGSAFEWCAGPLFLFAAGHFNYFAKLIVSVSDTLSNERLRKLLSFVERAVTPIAPNENRAELAVIQRELKRIDAMPWADLQKQRAKRIARAHSERQQARLERLVWVLDGLEEAAFDDAFERIAPDGGSVPERQTVLFTEIDRNWKRGKLDAVKEKHPAVVTAILLTKHPEIGLAMQRQITLSSLARAMS